jgi:hypothetical protein
MAKGRLLGTEIAATIVDLELRDDDEADLIRQLRESGCADKDARPFVQGAWDDLVLPHPSKS